MSDLVAKYWLRTKRRGAKLLAVGRSQADGQALVEVLLALALAALMLPALATALITSREGRALAEKRLQATALANEANEALVTIREGGWNPFTISGDFYPTISGGTWLLSSGSETIGDFTRTITISDVQRNSSGAIVDSGGTNDPSTKEVTIAVAWTAPIPETVETTTYFHRYLNNASWLQTTQAQFDAGTHSDTRASLGGAPVLIQGNTATDNAWGGSISQSFSSPVTIGSLIAVAVSWDPDNTPTCSDTLGNSYTMVINEFDAFWEQSMAICYAISASGGANTVTVNFAGSALYRRLLIHEYSGIDQANPLDTFASQIADSTTDPDNVTSGPITTANDGSLIFGAVMSLSGSTLIDAGTGFTQRESVNNKDLVSQDLVQSAAGTIASTQTFGDVRTYAAGVVAFNSAIGSPGTDGDVILGPGYIEVTDWTNPSVVASYDTPGNQNARDVFALGNYAYTADGSEITIFDISDPENPQVASTYAASGGIRHIYVEGNYMYLSSPSNSRELQIVDVSNPSNPQEVSTVNLQGSANANGAFVLGNYAYVVRDKNDGNNQDEFYIINVSNPSNPQVLGSINYGENIYNVRVSGDYAYLATAHDSQEAMIVDVSNKNSPSITSTYDVPGSGDATDLAKDGDFLFVATNDNGGSAELLVLNVSNPSSPFWAAQYDPGGSVNGVSTNNGIAFLATSISGRRLIVLDASNPGSGSLPLLAELQLSGNAQDVKTKTGNYAYIASNSNSEEFIIVGPDITLIPGGDGYAPTGEYTSQSFNAGASVAYNNIDFSLSEPIGTNITFQVAVNDDDSTWNYVGPDGTSGTFYQSGQAIALGTTGQFLRFRAYLSSNPPDYDVTPVIESVTINYSP